MERRQPVIWFVNRFFYPDESATSQILTDVACHLAASGFFVRIITSRLSYTGGEAFAPRATHQGVRIHRIATTSFGRSTLPGRALDYLSFYASAFFSVLKSIRRGDVCVVKTDPPLLSIPLSLAVSLKRAKLVNWLQDIYPDVAAELGVSLAKGPLGAVLKRLRNRSWRKAAANVAIGSRMADLMRDAGVPADRISIIQNFADDEQIQPLPLRTSPLRGEWGFGDDDFVIAYSGNLGRAHDYHTLLAAARRLADAPHVQFLFIGGGKLRDLLEQELSRSPLPSVHFQPYQPRERLAESLGAADLHWVSLQPALEGLIVPSKLYGVAAAGRGVLFIGDPDGEAARLLETTHWGLTVDLGDDAHCARVIRELAADPDRVKRMGENARRFTEEQGARRRAFAAWSDLASRLTSTMR